MKKLFILAALVVAAITASGDQPACGMAVVL